MDEMVAVLDRFVSGEDNSIQAAARLKDLIVASFAEDSGARAFRENRDSRGRRRGDSGSALPPPAGRRDA